ncbi:porin [Dechloromonas sp. ZS-1]|uniref:porin n=1 Tax=Dechloromonas sp. ZS-1 TaxID=3138067 RepID=UPI0031FC3123
MLLKKIIALAVAAAASSAAFAQSNVTVYGAVDLGQAFVKSSGSSVANTEQGTVGRLDNNSSHIGFKGVEDLGNGLKALFTYEVGFAADTGVIGTTNTYGTRDAYIGLTGGFGTVVAGNLTHPLRAFGAKVELTPAAAGFGTMASVTGTIAGLHTGADNRANNAVAYVSPSFGGFSGTVAYINGEQKTNAAASATADANVNTRAYQVAAQYDNGPLFVGAGYHKAKEPQLGYNSFQATPVTAAADGVDARVIRLAAVYTLPTATKLTALYDNTKVSGDGFIKRNAFSLGVAQSFGKNTVGVEYAQSGKIKTDAGTADQTKVSMWTAVYSYELSKRTMLHARYSRLANQDEMNTNFYLNPVNQGAATVDAAGANYTGYMVGLRHSF